MKSLKNTQTTLIQKQSMREQILSVLRTSILNHTYPMGSRLNLDELRRDLGVSNTPLREAISILEGEGLVEYRTNMGVFVASPSKEAHYCFAQYVLFLMLSAYDYCVETNKIDIICEEMQKELDKQALYVKKGDIYHYALCSNNFDRCIIDATENPCLIKNYDQNFNLLTLMNAEYAENDKHSMKVFFHQHEQILEAIRQKKPESVHALLKEHYYKEDWIL